MARVRTSVFAARKGATLKCSVDGEPIQKGERYYWWKPGFRSRYKVIRCMKHAPKPSETNSSKLSTIMAAQETAEEALDALVGYETSDIEQIVNDVAQAFEDVAEEYRDAAEASPTGLIFGEDYNEKADTLENSASDLQSWSPSEDEPDYEHETHASHPDNIEEGDDTEPVEDADPERCEECADARQEWWDNMVEEARSAIQDADMG